MLVLNNGDKIRGGASIAGVIDYTIHGLVGEDLNRFADGQLSDLPADLYTATNTVVVTSFVLVNTDSVTREVNLYIQPEGGTSRRIITKDLSLGVGHSLHYDGVNVNVLGPSSGLNVSTFVELTDTPAAYDEDKYLRSTVDGIEWATVSGGTGTSVHSELSNLDYDDSEHTGFASDNDLTVLSGTLQTEIDNIPVSLIDLVDTPSTYDEDKYLRSTVDGIEWATVSGSGSQTFLDLIDTPTTYSGSVGSYLKTTISGIEFFEQVDADRVVYVAKNGSDTTERGGVTSPFITIQAAIDYMYNRWGEITDQSNPVLIRVAPGIYEEQLHSYNNYIIASYISGHDSLYGSPPATLYNTGEDAAHYPLRSNEDEYYLMIGMNVLTDAGGVLGKIPFGNFQHCRFNKGHFIERETSNFVSFSSCTFADSGYGGFYMVGTDLTGFRNIILQNFCEIRNKVTPYLQSTHTGFANFKLTTVDFRGSIDLGGDWEFRLTSSYIFGKESRNIFDTDEEVHIIDSIIVNGLHFKSNPGAFIMAGSSFEGVGTNRIPDGEADITADVPILNAQIKNTVMHNGLDGEIQIVNPIKTVGYGLSDSYRNITEALKSSSSGETVQVYHGTYNENINIPVGVNIYGSSKEATILTSTSGTLLTNYSSGNSYIRNFTFMTSASGINNTHLLNSTAGTINFIDCSLYVSLVDTYTEAITITNSNLILNDTDVTYTQTGDTVGSGIVHRVVYFDGDSTMEWMGNSTTNMVINDSNDLADATLCESSITSNIEIFMKSSSSSFLSQNPLWGGNAYAMKVVGTLAVPVSTSELTVSVIGAGGAGTGYVFYVDTSNNNGTIYGTLNVLTATGFTKNYVGCVEEGDTFNSHFDMLNAVDLVCGGGTVNYVTSPGAGNLMISGSYINMYNNDLIVAKRGGEFTSLKAALESITDNSSTNRYNIHVHSGFYTEDNPIELKPYVYISGAFKHNPRIVPANPLEHLFVVPTGYCTCDFGEITLQVPVGDSDHSVYMVYAGPGSKPIIGFYNCLFLGAGYGNGDYCNGFYDEEVLSGYHTVNCMLYGEFNKFAYMNGGSWTDSGTLPEFTTVLNHYLYMTGEGTALIDLMRNTGYSFENLIYVNHADAKIVLSDVYSLDQKTLITGPLGGDVQLRGSSLNGKLEIDAGDIIIHSGSFENNSYLEALTGNLSSLMITSTRNKNENTYCIKVVGGGSTEIYLGGGNIFDSPNGVQSIQLSGSFSNVQVEGVRQYNIASLLNGESITLTHLPDLDYSRLIQVQAFPSTPGTADVDYITLDEDKYTQEDYTKTDFIDGKVTLSGIGLIPYAHWHMNEITGGSVSDSSGFNRDGTGNKVDNADWIAGKLNNCLKFDAVDEYVSFGNIASWERTDSFSIDCWFYTTTDVQMYVLSKMENVTGKGYGFYLNARKPYFVLGNNVTTNKIEVYSDVAVSSGAWHHGIFTYDGSSTASGINMYIDGDNKTLTTVSDALSATIVNTADFQMSGRDGQNLIFNYGRVDEAVLYEKEMLPIEASYRYNSGLGIEDIVCTHNTDKGWYITTTSGSNFDSSTWTNIAQMVFTEIIPQYTQINYLLSTDGRVIWKYWDANVWSSATLSGIDTYGNSSDTLEGLNIANWSSLFTTSSGVFDIAASLKTTHSGTAPSLDKIEIVYSIPGPRQKIGDSDIVVEYTDEITTKITNSSGGKLTGIKCNILKIQPY